MRFQTALALYVPMLLPSTFASFSRWFYSYKRIRMFWWLHLKRRSTVGIHMVHLCFVFVQGVKSVHS